MGFVDLRFNWIFDVLSVPFLYKYIRNILVLGIPYKKWIELSGLNKPNLRVVDIGCGPSDIIDYLQKGIVPSFYLGIDISDRYLITATNKAKTKGLDCKFLKFDLTKLADSEYGDEFVNILNKFKVNHVLLIGVLHHISDFDIQVLFRLLYKCNYIKSIHAQDVVFIPNNLINNFFAKIDRGLFVRTTKQYADVINTSNFVIESLKWSTPGLKKIKYIHHELKRGISN